MRRSLTIKLLLAFLIVGLTGTVLTAVVVGPATFGAFARFVDQIEDGRRPFPMEHMDSERMPMMRFPEGTPERDFENRFGRLLLLGMSGAAGVAVLLGVLLSNTLARPIQELTEATNKLSGGELGAQVPVRSQDELGRLAASFNQMSADLAEANRLRRQMTADIAHDLRTPLSIIAGYTEALSEGVLPGSPETFDVMHQQVEHLKHLVEDLRTLSLADAGELPLNRRPVDPRALLERTALAYMGQAETAQVEIVVDAPADLPPLSVDTERLTQVLNNLVGNALRHTPAGGKITLTAAPGELRVIDTGQGIAAEALPHIFERFYRADQARGRSAGESGLGLAIVRSIVAAHGGAVRAESAGPGQGSAFVMELPTAAGD